MNIKILNMVMLDADLSKYKSAEQSKKDGTLQAYQRGVEVTNVSDEYFGRFSKYPTHIEIDFNSVKSTTIVNEVDDTANLSQPQIVDSEGNASRDDVTTIDNDDDVDGDDDDVTDVPLSELKIGELKDLAKDYKIKGYANMKHAQLVDAITEYEAEL